MRFAFKLAKVEKSVTIPEAIHNPYLAARHEWDERYGDLVTRAKNWRTMALVSGLIALVATGGMLWLSARSRVVPHPRHSVCGARAAHAQSPLFSEPPPESFLWKIRFVVRLVASQPSRDACAMPWPTVFAALAVA